MTKLNTTTLKGRYQANKNIHVGCFLDVAEATDRDLKVFIGLKSRGDTAVPVGTRLEFDAEAINKINERRTNSFDTFYATVQAVQDINGTALHICTPIMRETHPNRRSAERKATHFPIYIPDETGDAKVEFLAVNGNGQGLTLVYASKRAMLSLALNHPYEFEVAYKETPYHLPAEIRHIEYDWRNHAHVIGLEFGILSRDQEIILNLLIDPSYSIKLSSRQSIDTAEGKISMD